MEIQIPDEILKAVLLYASSTELCVEDVVSQALKNYLERGENDAQQ